MAKEIKNLPWVNQMTDGSYRAHAWHPEGMMEALNIIYRQLQEVMNRLDEKDNGGSK